MRKHILLAVSVLLAFIAPGIGLAQTSNQAGLVIQFPDGRVETACVAFDDDAITGLDLLNRSGLTVNVDYSTGLGATVCKIGEIGCDAPGESCFCQCMGAPCYYWNYWTLEDGQWSYSPLGASSHLLSNGDVDGWVWGQGKEPPEIMSFEQICGFEAAVEAFASPLDTPTRAPAPRPTLVHTPSPTATSPPSPLPSPTSQVSTAPLSPTPTPVSKVFIPATSGDLSDSDEDTDKVDLSASLERYAGLAGVVAVLALIVVIVWRRQRGE